MQTDTILPAARIRHLKRQTTYRIIGQGVLDCGEATLADNAALLLNYCEKTGGFRIHANGTRIDRSVFRGTGHLQCDTNMRSGDALVIYEDEKTGHLWFRPPGEFTADRFELIELPSACKDAEKAKVEFQPRVQEWMQSCFGPEISADRLERADRLLEETLELLQSVDYPADRVQELVDYVYARPTGDTQKELGGVMVTLAAFAEPHGVDMLRAGEDELDRVWDKIDRIRAKQAVKPAGVARPS